MGDFPTQRLNITAAELAVEAERLLSTGMRPALVAAHQDPDVFRIVYLFVGRESARRTELCVNVQKSVPTVPSIASVSFPIGRFEREMRDLYGVVPAGHPLPHRLVRHGHWPTGWYPMRRDLEVPPPFAESGESYPFATISGNGVYEIPVGPIHAGLIEPGHFRFTVVGETILRMKARLWFLHKGIERLFEGRTPSQGVELAERISGDTAVGHGWAYAAAVEDALGIAVPSNVGLLRLVLLELERLHNHVSDLGMLCNDVGYGVINTQALAIKERLLRLNETVTGHRLLRGAIAPGITTVRQLPSVAEIEEIGADIAELASIALGNAGVLDRFTGTAILDRAAGLDVGVLGYVARASGIFEDARNSHPLWDVAGVDPEWFRLSDDFATGDVLARFRVRVQECAGSVAAIVGLLPVVSEVAETGWHGVGAGADTGSAGGSASGIGMIEGWRGAITHRVEIGADGLLSRVKIVDPSFFNWPALPLALADTIVPDFPLVNKSFNLSYAGNDL